MDRLSMNVQYVKGVGPKRASKLRRLDIHTVEDLIYFFPRNYEDRRKFGKIDNCEEGKKYSLKVEVIGYPTISRPRRNLSILKLPVKDDTGTADLVWFNQDYLIDKFKTGNVLIVHGKIKKFGRITQIINPVYEVDGKIKNKVGRIVPVYPLTEKLKNTEMIRIMNNALREYLVVIEEVLPLEIINEFNLMPIKDALYNIHFPKGEEDLKRARYRLVFEELLVLQLGMLLIKNVNNSNKGILFKESTEVDYFINNLPFRLTTAQIRVLKEIERDMNRDRQMNRLVQGDVGSGKTVIAVIAMIKAWDSGYQSVMMAPTEILAVQHYETVSQMLKGLNINCELLVGSLSSNDKEEVLNRLASGDIDVLIGTHAIIQERVKFFNLGLTITDEQHRFGVKQRAMLSQKGMNPDNIVMTATPIPRTLALILYGDLDISIIDELPPGRKKIETYAVGNEMEGRVINFIKKQIKEGRQAYIVSPLIEESDSLNLRAAEELFEKYSNGVFKQYRLGLLHGRMNGEEKDNIMNKFKNGEIDILISTTVIEVGVNVPNANIMVIYNAERFGLAQLHQLRGRVGRGNYQSYCILFSDGKNSIARERMRIMQKTNDGFEISEKDLELRGPGEFFGTRQHGLPDLKIANLFTDMEVLKSVQIKSMEILKEDPLLMDKKYVLLKNNIEKMFKGKIEHIALN